jgi:[ribosomal protein S5]-alanine N-acetyltransferase
MVPRLYTPRLTLRGYSFADVPRVQELVSDRRIAAGSFRIPHPYPEGGAEKWFAAQSQAAAEGKAFTFAVTLTGTRTPGRDEDFSDTGHVIGTVVLELELAQYRADLGYWIGAPYWNKGFATEAARAVLDFGFSRTQFHRIVAQRFAFNVASERVLEKLGFAQEGILRQERHKDGRFHDVVTYGLLRDEWARQRVPRRPALRVTPSVRAASASPPMAAGLLAAAGAT